MAFVPAGADVEQTILISVNSKTDQAEKGLKQLTKTVKNEFGEITKTYTEVNKKTGEVMKTITKENELFVNKMADFAKKNSAAIMAMAAATKALKEGFDLAMFAAQRSSSESARSFQAAHKGMIESIDRLKVALGTALMPALTTVANILSGLADTVSRIVNSVAGGSQTMRNLMGGKAPVVGAAENLYNRMSGNAAPGSGSGVWNPAQGIGGLIDEARSKASLIPGGVANQFRFPNVLAENQKQIEALDQQLSDVLWERKRVELGMLAKKGGGGGSVDVGRFKLPSGKTIQEEIDRITLELIAAEAASISAELKGVNSSIGTNRALQELRGKQEFRSQYGFRTKEGMQDSALGQLEASAVASRDRLLEEGAGEKFLENLFGPIQTFSVYEQAFMSLGNVASSSWNTVTAAVGAGVDAWITGQESVGKAIKMAIAESLRATAIQMSVEALKNTALGAAALFINPAAAGGYFTAAGIAGAAAVAAGAGAKALGGHTGQWEKPASAAASGGGGRSVAGLGSYGGANSGGSNITIIAGDPIYEVSGRRRRAMFGRAVNKARKMADDGSVVFA